MVKLNLPAIDCNIRKNQGKQEIFDIVRKKYVILTPEEWVRQHMIHYLHRELAYPVTLMQVERGLKYNSRQKRSDILVFDGSGVPAVLIECKSYKETQLRDKVMHQAAAYNNRLRARWIIITNGWGYYCWRVEPRGVIPEADLPEWTVINKMPDKK